MPGIPMSGSSELQAETTPVCIASWEANYATGGRARRTLARPSQSRSKLPILLAAFALTCQWGAVPFGPLQASDVLLAVMGATLLLRRCKFQRVPLALKILLGAMAISTVVALVFPPSTSYLSSRVKLMQPGGSLGRSALDVGFLGPWAFLTKFALATLVSGSVVRACVRNSDTVFRLLRWWVAGACLSAIVAVLQARTGWTPVGDVSDVGLRARGLTPHPNTCAFWCVATIPFLAVFYERRHYWVWSAGALTALWAGLLATDSRSGLATGLLATMMLPFLIWKAPRAAVTSVVGLLILLPIAGSAGVWLANSTRLAGSERSDVGRSMVYHQSILDFEQNPLFGLGLSKVSGAPSVPLSLLAGGGIVVCGAYSLFIVWLLGTQWRGRGNLFVRCSLSSTIVMLVVMTVQNTVLDRAQYVLPLLAVMSYRPRGGDFGVTDV